MAVSLTFVNQVGAVNGMNQAAPGSFIPETFVRWAQDVLFDRVGYIRRRAPFTLFPLYNNASVPTLTYPSVANERVLNVVSTIDPAGNRVTGFALTSPSGSRILFYDERFRNTGSSTIATIPQDAAFDAKQASNGGMWLSFMESYKPASGANEYFQYYWYGGSGIEQTVQNTRFGCKHTSNVKHRTFTDKIYAPQFTVTNSAKTSGVVTLTFASHTIAEGDSITVDMSDAAFDGTFVVTGVTTTTVSYAFAGADVPSGVDTGTVTQNFDISELTPGMFVYVTYSGADYYAGIVKRVEATEVTLLKDIIRWVYDTPIATIGTVTGSSPDERLVGQQIKFRNVRPFIHSHGRGLITRSSATTTTITSGSVGTEGEGHFQSADLAGTTLGVKWALYRASDGEWIGDVASVTDNAALTLDSDHHSNEPDGVLRADEYVAHAYLAVPLATITDADPTRFAGIFNATYASYQWFANAGNATDQNRVVFSAYHDAEAVDLSKDAADSIIVPTAEIRGIASSSAGLLVFTPDKTFLIRGNYRANFSLEELYPEGCLSAMSIVEYGGGVFWTSRIGIMFYDGASVRNLTENNLGVYYTDSVKTFDIQTDRVYSFLHKDHLFVHFNAFDSVFKPARYEPVYAEGITTTPAISDFQADDWDPDFTTDDFKVENNVPVYWDYLTLYGSTAATSTKIVPTWGAPNTTFKWGDPGTQYVWGPIQKSEGVTFAVYLPSNAITTLSNFGFRGAVLIDALSGIKAIMGVNVVNPAGYSAGVYPRIVDVDSILDTNNQHDTSIDDELIENTGKEALTYIKGPDFYLQTKHYTVGDPVLKKWFRQLFLNMFLLDGAVRLDVVDSEDNDRIDVTRKQHKNWELFGEKGYTWTMWETLVLPKLLSPNRSTWQNVEALNQTWYEVSDSEFERRKKKISWRYPTMGFRLYQMNQYRPANYQDPQRPHTVMIDSWNIGFKPMRISRA